MSVFEHLILLLWSDIPFKMLCSDGHKRNTDVTWLEKWNMLGSVKFYIEEKNKLEIPLFYCRGTRTGTALVPGILFSLHFRLCQVFFRVRFLAAVTLYNTILLYTLLWFQFQLERQKEGSLTIPWMAWSWESLQDIHPARDRQIHLQMSSPNSACMVWGMEKVCRIIY